MKMKTNQNKFKKDYISPSLTQQSLLNEGILCTSVPGAGIDNATEEDWGTI